MSKAFTYTAQRFAPRSGAEQQLLLFVAPAGDIRTWAGVPRKAFDFQHGFQRSLNEARVSDVAEYFRENTKNLSPTAVVIGLTGDISIESLSGLEIGDGYADVVRVTIPMHDLEELSLEGLADLTLPILRQRLPDDTVGAIDNDIDSALQEAARLQDESDVDERAGIAGDSAVESGVVEISSRSYLADFYAQLQGYRKRLLPWPPEQQIRQVLYSFLKPGIIVDGQHRVFGASTVDESMLMAVCAIPAADWVESVFQFVIINQKAKPIRPAFLSSIVATSLSSTEIKEVYDRLSSASIDVERSREMELLNTDPESPFRDMIDFNVEAAPGFLQFPGMLRLARDFAAIPRTHPVLLKEDQWPGPDGWMPHFFALWRGVRKYFEATDARLWQRPTEDNPNNLLKIVTLQEVQSLMLDNWADSRAFQLEDPTETERRAEQFWSGFPSTFFTDEWRKKGLQTSVGRRIIRDAITETRRNLGRKGWGHRRLGLFSE